MARKRRSYSYEDYRRAMDLLDRGLGLTETCRILGWPETEISLLHYWRHGRHRPPTARWTPELSRRPAKYASFSVSIILRN